MRPWDDNDALGFRREQSYRRLSQLRRSQSVGTSVPHSKRETPEAFTAASIWPEIYKELNRHWGYWGYRHNGKRMTSADVLEELERRSETTRHILSETKLSGNSL